MLHLIALNIFFFKKILLAERIARSACALRRELLEFTLNEVSLRNTHCYRTFLLLKQSTICHYTVNLVQLRGISKLRNRTLDGPIADKSYILTCINRLIEKRQFL